MTLCVINPNSSQGVTDGIAAGLAPLHAWGHPIRCLTLAEGPPGIETQAQADRVVAPMLDLAAAQSDATGFVVACFGDPGVHALRAETDLPVVGIQEAAFATAITLGQRFGIIAIRPASIPRHRRAVAAAGLGERLAGDRALDLGVTELADRGRTFDRMVDTARALRDLDGAEVLILGCAGMAGYRRDIEAATGLPVVEPCEVAVAIALGRIALTLTHRRDR